MTAPSYDAVLLVSFGGPEKAEDVMPFLENVTRGRNIPRERLLGVAEHYYHFGGRSPINDQNRALLKALGDLLGTSGPHLPLYWGNRNWHPLLVDTVRQMRADGIRRALAFVTSAFSSYSACRQYREDIARARDQVGEGAPEIEKLRLFYNHPGFIGPVVEHMRTALGQLPAAELIFTAHSIPNFMAETSLYREQLNEACRLVSEAVGRSDYSLVYQSRSGSPSQPWLGPDICDYLRDVHVRGRSEVIICPIGFVSDHMEILFDLDTEARAVCEELGIKMVRTPTVGTHPEFVQMVRELILERLEPSRNRVALGVYGPGGDRCSETCCPPPQRA